MCTFVCVSVVYNSAGSNNSLGFFLLTKEQEVYSIVGAIAWWPWGYISLQPQLAKTW